MLLAEAAIKTLMDAHSGLSGLIGTNSFELLLPQSPTYPCVTYFRPSTPARESMMGDDASFARPTITVEVWSTVNSEVKAVVAQVINCLRRYRGIVSSGQGSITILDIFLQGESYSFDSTTRLYSGMLNFEVINQE